MLLDPYLWGYPFLSAGCLCLDHALGPGSDIPSTVISVTLEDQLARALLAGTEGPKCHAISDSVQDLKPVKKHIREQRGLGKDSPRWDRRHSSLSGRRGLPWGFMTAQVSRVTMGQRVLAFRDSTSKWRVP
jgi:hypothetical protein